MRGMFDALYGIPGGLPAIARDPARAFARTACSASADMRPDRVAGGQTGAASAAPSWNKIRGFTKKMWHAQSIRSLPHTVRAPYLPTTKVMETGNPVRSTHVDGAPKARRSALLIFGGSGGAHRIDDGRPRCALTHD